MKTLKLTGKERAVFLLAIEHWEKFCYESLMTAAFFGRTSSQTELIREWKKVGRDLRKKVLMDILNSLNLWVEEKPII